MNPKDGHCYELALMAIINGEPGTLVHGVVEGYGPHAWIENNNGFVFDVVSDTRCPASHYPGRCERRYTRTEALQTALRYLHCGPWPPNTVKGEPDETQEA